MSEPGYCCGISRPHVCCDCGERRYCSCGAKADDHHSWCMCDACASGGEQPA